MPPVETSEPVNELSDLAAPSPPATGLEPEKPAPAPTVTPEPKETPKPPAAAPESARLVSLDAYRGFIMLAMASASLALPEVVKKLYPGDPSFGGDPVWQGLAFQSDHVRWAGCSFWDLIQPSFMFMVGVAMPYSYASRKTKGQSERKMFWHAVIRAVVLVLLGVFLSSNWSKQTDWSFVNVLSQIGLGYVFIYLLLWRGVLVQLLALVAILAGYWALFAYSPLPGADFNYEAMNSTAKEQFTGFFAHWDKNANIATAFDQWFLNLFPRPEEFWRNNGGYATLNFIPSMATMLLGLMAGELLCRHVSSAVKLVVLALIGAACLAGGEALERYEICPIVKRIWTPAWAIYSAGWTFLILAAFYLVIDIIGWKRWSFALVVVGMNSIAMYMMSQLMKPWIRDTIKRHFGQTIFDGTYFGFEVFPAVYAPIASAVLVLLMMWLACLWMYRQRMFVRI